MPRIHVLVPVACLAAACGSESTFVNQSYVDTFEQTPNDQVDILFVIDDSNSMAEEQQALVDGFTGFIRSLEDANSKFHIGVVSTSADSDDPHAGELLGHPAYLTADDDYVSLFRSRAQVGIDGSDKEKGLQSAALAVSPELLAGANAGFLRPDAHLLVAVVSDEEDCSDDGVLDGYDASACYHDDQFLSPVSEYVDELVAAKGGRKDLVSFGAIIGPTLAGGCDTAHPGLRYARAVQLLGGTIGDICTADWSDMLYSMGLTATGIVRDFTLSWPALPDTLAVTVDDVAVPAGEDDGWTYDDATTTISFHGDAVPARGAQITVEYDIQP